MIISLNYAIFALAFALSLDLFRRDSNYRNAATQLMLFALAALFGGIAHFIQLENNALNHFLNFGNQLLPKGYEISSLETIFDRVWFVTFILIGLTEYYFMRIFLYPLSDAYGYTWIKPLLMGSLIVYSLATLLIGEYSLVVTYHLFTHTLVIGFSLYLIFKQGISVFWTLILLVVLNLLAGVVWGFMALGKIPTGPLHYNDWYHIILLIFLVFLHWSLTKGGLVAGLQSICKPPSKQMS